MKLHDLYFWLVMAFLGGIFIFSIVGFYSDAPTEGRFGKQQFTGVIREAEQRLNSQKLVVGDIQITTSRYPQFHYGDEIRISGAVRLPMEDFSSYYKKEGIGLVMSFPEIELLATGKGNPVKSFLFNFRDSIKDGFKKVLPFDQAAFLSGLTLGDTSEFSDEFEEKLRLTGTSHLVALSGYNISIIVKTITVALGSWWLARRFRFLISVLVILGFVMMTGAEASVVRAAIMAALVLMADQVRRPYHFRNAMATAALAMAVFNPNLLAFDAGFQLSFAALLGIVYLAPHLKRWLKLKDAPGILNWREHFLNTSAAQLAVLPILLINFGYFSPIGILTNVLILGVIPLTMALGFLLGVATLFSTSVAWLIALPTVAFLSYEIWIINLCVNILKIFI